MEQWINSDDVGGGRVTIHSRLLTIRDLFRCVITALQLYIIVLKCVIFGNRGGLNCLQLGVSLCEQPAMK